MLFTTAKENLLTAVNAVQRAINQKSIIPTYSCIKIDVREHMAVFMGTGLDISIECTIPVQMEKEGSALVPARYFSDIVRRLPNIPITVEHTASMEMSLRYEKSVFTLRTLPVDDFPLMPSFQDGLSFSISAESLKKLIRQSTFAASPDELKAVFTGILWEIDEDALSLVGTDTHRLAWSKSKFVTEDPAQKGSFIIPAKITSEIGRLLEQDDCIVQAEKNAVFFAFDNIKMHCRVLEGIFPNYKQVVPQAFQTTIKIDGRILKEAAERISLFAESNDTSNTIQMEAEEGKLSLYSQSDIGFGREEFAIMQEGEAMHIAFNARYITDVFKAIEGEKVSMQLSGQLSAGIIKEEGDPDFLYLVLPVKV